MPAGIGLFHLTLLGPHRIIAHGAGKGRFYQITLIAGAAGERKDNAMKNTTMGLEKFEEELLAFQVSDEALEIAAGTS